jgi:adenylate cyclase
LIDPENANMRYNFACVLAVQLNELDAAMDLLEPVLQEITISLYHNVLIDPDLDCLRSIPRFQNMLAATAKRLGVELPTNSIPAGASALLRS